MRVWRIAPHRYLNQVWDGLGGLHAAGRWHERGVRIVYAAEHPAVCALEILVHLDRQLVPTDFFLCEAFIPDELITTLPVSSLPDDWASWPAGKGTRRLGMSWLAKEEHLALRVPSAAAPRSFNVLINPLHPEAHQVRAISREPWTPDSRLLVSAD